MPERIVVGADGRKYITTEPSPPQRPAEQVQVGWNWMLDGQPYGPAYYGNPPDADITEIGAESGRTVRLLYAIEEER